MLFVLCFMVYGGYAGIVKGDPLLCAIFCVSALFLYGLEVLKDIRTEEEKTRQTRAVAEEYLKKEDCKK